MTSLVSLGMDARKPLIGGAAARPRTGAAVEVTTGTYSPSLMKLRDAIRASSTKISGISSRSRPG